MLSVREHIERITHPSLISWSAEYLRRRSYLFDPAQTAYKSAAQPLFILQLFLIPHVVQLARIALFSVPAKILHSVTFIIHFAHFSDYTIVNAFCLSQILL